MIRRENNMARRVGGVNGLLQRECCCTPIGCDYIYIGTAHHGNFPSGYPLGEYNRIRPQPMCLRELVFVNRLTSLTIPFQDCADTIDLNSPDYVLRRCTLESPPNFDCIGDFLERYKYVTCPPVYWNNGCDFNRVSTINAGYTLPAQQGDFLNDNGILAGLPFDYADIKQAVVDEICADNLKYASAALSIEIFKWCVRKRSTTKVTYFNECKSIWKLYVMRHEDYVPIPACPDIGKGECIPKP